MHFINSTFCRNTKFARDYGVCPECGPEFDIELFAAVMDQFML